MGALTELFIRDRFAHEAGIRLVCVRPGYAKARLTVEERHLNAVDVVQGGAIFTLADLAFAAACNSRGVVAVAIQISISFCRGTASGTLTAEATEIHRNPKLSNCSIRVTNEKDELVAIFEGLAYVKKDPMPEPDEDDAREKEDR